MRPESSGRIHTRISNSRYFFSYHITSIISANIPANPASPNCDMIRPNPAITPKKSSNRIPTMIPMTTNVLATSVSCPSHSFTVCIAFSIVSSCCQERNHCTARSLIYPVLLSQKREKNQQSQQTSKTAI